MTATREKQKRYFVVSFDCRSFVVRLSVVCRSVVVRLSFGCRSVVARLSRFVVRLSLVCRSTVARLKKCCRSVVVRLSFGLKIIISKLSFDCRSIVVRLLLDCGGGCRTMSFVVARLPSLPRMTAAPRHSVCRPVTHTHDGRDPCLSRLFLFFYKNFLCPHNFFCFSAFFVFLFFPNNRNHFSTTHHGSPEVPQLPSFIRAKSPWVARWFALHEVPYRGCSSTRYIVRKWKPPAAETTSFGVTDADVKYSEYVQEHRDVELEDFTPKTQPRQPPPWRSLRVWTVTWWHCSET